jgi:hypothetical protein
MPRKTNYAKEKACRARGHRWPKSATPSANTLDSAVNQPTCENECTNWDGSLNHFTVEELEQSDTDDETDDEEEFMELEGDELLQSLQQQGEREQAAVEASIGFRELQRTITKKEWKRAESSKRGVYNGGAINLIDVLLNSWCAFSTRLHRYSSYLSYLILYYIMCSICVRKN